ncbi:helix-turn-helix domain-containing protein [Pseudovibrio sp. Tun.PSC04-5.I4]|uniref:helix-turn-helix domain-containing protein n=1 Tax=Pseudovibrio sp. Tun.PSC04-5.I4 TaxID=1798213 RepID=UPI00088FBBE1|nr:helix-turn-helix domain-containing protein [Pseudovibrio sp. Tun.PSC04-5.I4]SDR02293.1 Helix-turn-helix domain-containing protein [Pseudovibrio sp. Tun.PSC04-5.I4]
MHEIQTLTEWRREFSRCHLPSSTNLVLHAISLFAAGVGEVCSPSVRDLAEHTSLSTPIVTKHLRNAERCGWLGIRKYGPLGEKLKRNEYMPKLPEMEVEGWT